MGMAAALFSLVAPGCGLHAHPGTLDEGSGGSEGITSSGGSTGSGGSDSGSGGATGSGGQVANGSGGDTGSGGGTSSGGSGSGGSTGSGGNSGTSTGGNSGTSSGGKTGSGGSAPGSGGTTSGSGGATSGSGGSSSSAGVMINGQFVPKDNAVVFIHFGHSNMRGQATKPSSLMSYFYNTVPGLWSYKGSFMLAKEPTAPEGTMTFAGPGMAILHSAQAAAGGSGTSTQFISVGYGIGSKTSVDYLKATNTYYPIFMKWAGQLKGNVTFGGIVIMLGITDGEHLPSDQVPGFPGRIKQIVSDIRADLGEPNLPVLFCDYEQEATGTLAPTGSVGVVMQPLVRMLPGMIDKLVLVPTNGLSMQDDHHFDMQGHKDWADRLIMLMQNNNWFPWK